MSLRKRWARMRLRPTTAAGQSASLATRKIVRRPPWTMPPQTCRIQARSSPSGSVGLSKCPSPCAGHFSSSDSPRSFNVQRHKRQAERGRGTTADGGVRGGRDCRPRATSHPPSLRRCFKLPDHVIALSPNAIKWCITVQLNCPESPASRVRAVLLRAVSLIEGHLSRDIGASLCMPVVTRTA